METLKLNQFGHTRLWWLILCVGVLFVIGGFTYWLLPMSGYAIASQMFGWMVLIIGVVQLCVSAGANRPRGWGWWLAGGILDIFIGFMLVRSVLLSEVVFPYVLAFLFIYWGIGALFGGFSRREGKYWWVKLINGGLMMLLGYFFLEAGYYQDAVMVSFLTSLAFIYWGFTLAISAYELRPKESVN